MFHVKQQAKIVKKVPENKQKVVSSGFWLAVPALVIFMVIALASAYLTASEGNPIVVGADSVYGQGSAA